MSKLAAKNASLFQNGFSKKCDQIDMETAYNFSKHQKVNFGKKIRLLIPFFKHYHFVSNYARCVIEKIIGKHENYRKSCEISYRLRFKSNKNALSRKQILKIF